MACNGKLAKSLKKLLSAVRKLVPTTCRSSSAGSISRSISRRGNNYKQLLAGTTISIKGGQSHRLTSSCKKGWLPVVCVGSSSCKRYTIALHQLRSPALVQILADTAAEYGYGLSKGGALAIACEPHTFEATFCLLQRSCQGLAHDPPKC